jgi:SAM-dependent methyltransferase
MLERAVTSLRLRLADATDLVLGRRDPLVPPRRRQFVGNSDFRATGEEFRVHLHRFAELTPHDRVLDIGCGIGRIARVLVTELAPPSGSYDGFDVARDGISWCQSHYTSTPVPFRFVHVDLRHPVYNPKGTEDAATFSFPYPDASFDLAIATSLFTHLLDASAERYIAESARVLAPGGRLFATWFVLDESWPTPEQSTISFRPTSGAALVVDPSEPERAVGYPLTWIRRCLERHGLTLREPYQRGAWTGQPGASSQDILVADRAATGTHG